MRRVVIMTGLAVIISAMTLCMTGCGGAPLAKTADELNKLIEQGAYAEEYASYYADNTEKPIKVYYDEAKDALSIGLSWRTDLDKLFDVLYGTLNGKDIGSLTVFMTGTALDGFEALLSEKLGKLECNSIEMLGVCEDIADSRVENHDWTILCEKTNTLYIKSPYAAIDFVTYSDEEKARFDNITCVDVSTASDNVKFSQLSLFKNLETIAIVDGSCYESVLEEEDTESTNRDANTAGDATAAESESTEGTSAENTTDEDSTEAEAVLKEFEYGRYSRGIGAESEEDMLSLVDMTNIKTLLIYPETGYTLTESGEEFIAALQFIAPDMQVNPPDKAYTEGETVNASSLETPVIGKERQHEIFAEILGLEVKDVYEECKTFEESPSEAQISGKVLVYEDQPTTKYWGSERSISSTGKCFIDETEAAGLSAPQNTGDYNTFVLIYPTYAHTGKYTSGTLAYKKTLNVQVFDLEKKVAYKAETVDSAAAPNNFSYYKGSAPDKYSGSTDVNKAFDYLKGLKKEA